MRIEELVQQAAVTPPASAVLLECNIVLPTHTVRVYVKSAEHDPRHNLSRHTDQQPSPSAADRNNWLIACRTSLHIDVPSSEQGKIGLGP